MRCWVALSACLLSFSVWGAESDHLAPNPFAPRGNSIFGPMLELETTSRDHSRAPGENDNSAFSPAMRSVTNDSLLPPHQQRTRGNSGWSGLHTADSLARLASAADDETNENGQFFEFATVSLSPPPHVPENNVEGTENNALLHTEDSLTGMRSGIALSAQQAVLGEVVEETRSSTPYPHGQNNESQTDITSPGNSLPTISSMPPSSTSDECETSKRESWFNCFTCGWCD